MSSSFLLPAISIVLLGLALLLFTDTDGSKRRLRERVVATRELKARQSDIPDAMADTQTISARRLRIYSVLGYDVDLPRPYAASPTIVGPVAAIVGLIVFNLSGRIIPAGFALLASVATAFFLARFLFRRKSKAYTALLFKQIPDAMSLMLRAVRAGLPVAEAIRNVGRESMSPTQDEFTRVAGEAALGMPVEVALRRLADRTTLQEYAFFSVIIGLHAQTGGNLSETLENMADMVRRRVAMAGKGKALSAEGRLSMAVIAVLPFIAGLLTSISNPDYLMEFITNPSGPTLLGVFVVLLGAGLFVSNLMIQRSTQD